jgi:hypothetical protein
MLYRIINTLWVHVTPENINRVISAIGGRRFLLSLGSGVITSLLVWYGKIDGSIYRDVVLGTVGIYIAGNTFQKVKQGTTPSAD